MTTTDDYIRCLVDDWPPLTAEQRDRVRVLLAPTPRPAATTGRAGRSSGGEPRANAA